jgi:hypothetical protein
LAMGMNCQVRGACARPILHRLWQTNPHRLCTKYGEWGNDRPSGVKASGLRWCWGRSPAGMFIFGGGELHNMQQLPFLPPVMASR